MPHWLIPTAFVALVLSAFLVNAVSNTRRQVARTLARRRNPTRDEFIASMGNDASPEASAFLWETVLSYISPKLTPHPDDDLVRDLPIDDGDWSMDWPRDYARSQCFHESNLPDWPKGWPATLRNYGRWLSMGPI